MKRYSPYGRGGFTLVELLIVIVVIAILATIGVMAYNGFQHKAYDAKVDATLNQVEKAIRAYVTRGNDIRLRHYTSSDFYAAPGLGSMNSGIRTYSGGGLGRALNEAGVLAGDLQQPLKVRGPKRDTFLSNRIRLAHCGKSKLFIIIEAYSGIKEQALNDKMRALNCAYRNEMDWRTENGLPSTGGWGTGGGAYRVQPYYKIAEIDL